MEKKYNKTSFNSIKIFLEFVEGEKKEFFYKNLPYHSM